MPTRRTAHLLFLTTGLMLSIAWPVHAEYHWNPFDHMTNEQAGMVFIMVGVFYLFSFLGWPLLLGSLTYLILKRTHPIASAKISRVLLFCCLTMWVLSAAFTPFLYKLLPTTNYPVYSIVIGILRLALEVAGAAFGYFQQRDKAVT